MRFSIEKFSPKSVGISQINVKFSSTSSALAKNIYSEENLSGVKRSQLVDNDGVVEFLMGRGLTRLHEHLDNNCDEDFDYCKTLAIAVRSLEQMDSIIC